MSLKLSFNTFYLTRQQNYYLYYEANLVVLIIYILTSACFHHLKASDLYKKEIKSFTVR